MFRWNGKERNNRELFAVRQRSIKVDYKKIKVLFYASNTNTHTHTYKNDHSILQPSSSSSSFILYSICYRSFLFAHSHTYREKKVPVRACGVHTEKNRAKQNIKCTQNVCIHCSYHCSLMKNMSFKLYTLSQPIRCVCTANTRTE